MTRTLTLEDLQIPVTFNREVKKYNAAAKRRWNAVPHETVTLSGGPYDGQTYAASSDATLEFSVGPWRGKYRVDTAERHASWVDAQ